MKFVWAVYLLCNQIQTKLFCSFFRHSRKYLLRFVNFGASDDMKIRLSLEFISRALYRGQGSVRTVSSTSINQSAAQAHVQNDTHPSRVSYAHGATDVPLLHTTMGQILRNATHKTPDQTVFTFPRDDITKTYAEFLADVEQCAAGMISMGLETGDRVGIWSPNHYEWVLTQYACGLAGFVLVNVNPAYKASELEYCLQKVGIRMLVLPMAYKQQEFYSVLSQVCPSLQSARTGTTVHESKFPQLEHVVVFNTDEEKLPGTWDFHKDLMQSADSISSMEILFRERKIRPDEPANIQFTSGTTGHPKGATLTHHGMINNAYFIGRRIDFHKEKAIISCGPPLYHCFGNVAGSLATVVHNSSCVYPAPSWEAEATLQAIHNHKCTAVYGTPTMFIDLVNHPNIAKYNYDSLKTGIMAGAPCPSTLCTELIEKMNMTGFTIAYGSTETSPVSFQSLSTEPPESRVKSVGMIHPHLEAAVVNSDGVAVPLGERGELWTRGYSTMLGYWDDKAKTEESVSADQWYHSGDQAIMDERGCVMIVGRTKDCIIRGGENIYPAEIEEFLYNHPKIEQVQIVGVPDERFGEAVCAWIALHEHESLTEQDIKDYCHGKIAHYKIPRHIQFKRESDFPVTVTGKVQKFQIREIATRELGLDKVKTHFG